METQMQNETVWEIPKRIHYVWLGGGEKPELVRTCIESWHTYCPDFEIIEWNEQNFDIDSNAFVKHAVKKRLWAQAADVIRMIVMYRYGGIYVDTDLELIRPLDERILHNSFFAGYENELWPATCIFGAVQGHDVLAKVLMRYETPAVKINRDKTILNVHTPSLVLKKYYGIKLNGKLLRRPDGIALFPPEYFCPKHYITHRQTLTENTYAIHHYASTWHNKRIKRGAAFAKNARIILGRHIYKGFERIVRGAFLRELNKEYKAIEKQSTHPDAGEEEYGANFG